MAYEKVVEYCNKNNISVHEFEKRCGLGNGTVSKWRDVGGFPSVPTLMKIEEATGVPMLDWIKNTEE